MNYYCIRYLYSNERHGIYTNLPVTSETTTDITTAETWFDNAVKVHTQSWKGNSLVHVKNHQLGYTCCLKEALFLCEETAHMKGWYIIQLCCYTHDLCD